MVAEVVCGRKRSKIEGVLLLLFTPGVFLDTGVGVGIPLDPSPALKR